MSENSKISWTDHTFNGWWGCTKVSPACAHCYAETFAKRTGYDVWGPGKPRRLLSDKNWNEPLKWQWQGFMICPDCGGDLPAKLQKGSGIPLAVEMCRCGSKVPPRKMRRPRVFCSSMADWLDDEVPVEWLARLLKLIQDTPNLDWLLLTKRPENWYSRLHSALTPDDSSEWVESWLDCVDMPERGDVPENVWIGTTVENQEYADKRIPELLKIPARVRFLSVEPMLGAVDLRRWLMAYRADTQQHYQPLNKEIHWIICGGESGKAHKERELNLEWVRSLHDQCKAAGVPFFMKQDSGPKPGMRGRIPDDLWKQEFPNS